MSLPLQYEAPSQYNDQPPPPPPPDDHLPHSIPTSPKDVSIEMPAVHPTHVHAHDASFAISTRHVNITDGPAYHTNPYHSKRRHMKIVRYECLIQFLLQLIRTGIMAGACPNVFEYTAPSGRTAGLAIHSIFLILETLVFIYCMTLLVRQLLYGFVKPVELISSYVSFAMVMAAWYQLFYIYSFNTFRSTHEGYYSTTTVWSVWVAFWYYSATTVTATGLGDIEPVAWYPKLFTSIELIISLVFHVVIFAIGLHHFQLHSSTRPGALRAPVVESLLRNIRQRFPRVDRVRRFLMSWVFPVSVAIQALYLVFTYVADPDIMKAETNNEGFTALVLIMQFVQFAIIFLMSLRLVRNVNTSQITPGWLLQSYLSTVTLYGQFYLTIYLLAGKKSFHTDLYDPLRPDMDLPFIDYLFQFQWFSLGMMTTLGMGDVAAVHPVARLVVISQCAVQIFYSIVILGMGMSATITSIGASRSSQAAGATSPSVESLPSSASPLDDPDSPAPYPFTPVMRISLALPHTTAARRATLKQQQKTTPVRSASMG